MIRLAAVLLLAGQPTFAQGITQTAEGAVLRALDKYSGDVVDLSVRAGVPEQFDRLQITLSECRFPTDNPSGEAYAGLKIAEPAADKLVFEGWMIASSPALSAMEHPRYDVWVLRCAYPDT